MSRGDLLSNQINKFCSIGYVIISVLHIPSSSKRTNRSLVCIWRHSSIWPNHRGVYNTVLGYGELGWCLGFPSFIRCVVGEDSASKGQNLTAGNSHIETSFLLEESMMEISATRISLFLSRSGPSWSYHRWRSWSSTRPSSKRRASGAWEASIAEEGGESRPDDLGGGGGRLRWSWN